MNIDKLVSPQLRTALREHGWAKLAFAVVHERQGYPPSDTTLPSLIQALSIKIAVDHVNQALVRDGIKAYKELHDVE